MNTSALSSKSSWVLLCLLVFAPRMGLGAQEVPEAPAPEHAPVTSEAPTAVPEAPRTPTPSAERWHASHGVRLLAEAGAGLTLSAASGIAGLLGGWLLCSGGILEVSEHNRIFDCVNTPIVGALVMLPIGLTLGVWQGGEAVGGDGKLLATLAGTGASLLVVPALLWMSSSLWPLAVAAAVAGPMLGYELSQRAQPLPGQGPSLPSSARPRVQPVLAFSSRGAVLGLGGTF